MTEFSQKDIYEKCAGLVETEMDGAVILLSVNQGAFLELTGAAGAIWNAIDGSKNGDAIVASLLNQFDIDEKTCAEETQIFLRQALQKGLIKLAR